LVLILFVLCFGGGGGGVFVFFFWVCSCGFLCVGDFCGFCLCVFLFLVVFLENFFCVVLDFVVVAEKMLGWLLWCWVVCVVWGVLGCVVFVGEGFFWVCFIGECGCCCVGFWCLENERKVCVCCGW